MPNRPASTVPLASALAISTPLGITSTFTSSAELGKDSAFDGGKERRILGGGRDRHLELLRRRLGSGEGGERAEQDRGERTGTRMMELLLE